MVQESRLVLSIDSRSAEQKAEDLAKALRVLELVGLRSADSTGAAGKSFAGAGRDAAAGARGVDQMNNSLAKTSPQADAAMKSLKSLFAAATAGIGAMSTIDAADQWGQLASRMKMATKDADEYEHAQRRMAKSASETFRAINETREAFINMSPVIRDMGFSLDQSIDAVDTFSGLLVVNGANAERGAAAMMALSKSLQKGKVDADAWMTIYGTADTIVESLARSTGKTEEEIRKLGISGQLTARMLAEALAGDYQRVMAQVAEMPTTVRDALQNLNTAFTEYVGWANDAKGITAGMASGINLLGENFGTLANVVGVAAVGAIGVYTTRMGLAVLADLAKAKSAAATSLQQAALTARFNGTSVAAARLGVAMRSLHVAMGPAGWIGLLAAGAAGAYLFMDSAVDASKGVDLLTKSADEATEAIKGLTKIQADKALDDIVAKQGELKKETDAVFTSLFQLTAQSRLFGNETGVSLKESSAAFKQFRAELQSGADVGEATSRFVSAIKPTDELAVKIRQLAEQYETASSKSADAAERAQMLREMLSQLGAEAVTTSAAMSGFSEAGGTYIAGLRKQLEGLQDNGNMVKIVNRYIAEHTDLTETDAVALRSYAAAIESAKESNRAQSQSLKDNESSAKRAAKALADFSAQAQISVASTNALSAAYLTSAEAVSKATREQKIEAEVLKLGEKSRAQVTKRINEMEDALEALDVAKTIADMRRQNVELGKYGQALLAGGTATKEGRKALADYNDEREIEAALVGKTSKEIDKLLPKLREEQRIRRERSDNNDALEQLNALVNETRTSQEKANDEIERMRDLYASAETPAHIEAIRRKIVEIENETNIWAQATERAIDQVDQAGADFWETFLDGGKFSFSSLTDIAKKWAAEMLNMMTFKPLLTSFSNMLFGTNNSGGVGDVWGGLFGGSGNSGGGGFGNIVSLGKNIYSAYSTLTGVGAEVLAGYQSGGLSGAISGGAGYYGSMLSNAYSTVASWFGSTATSAATTAATSAATNAAANLGYGLGQNLVTGSLGSATGSATAAYAGATAGTAASSGWLSSLAGMATNPVGWVIAAITSGYQGQKLYNQGVRADASKIMGQTDNVAGQAFLWESAFNAKIHEWIDGAFRGIGIGGKALSWLGAGGSIHQSIWGPDGIIGKAIFGKQEQFKRTVGSAQGVYSGGEYTGTGAVAGWFGGSRRFGDDFDSALHDLNETFASSLGGLFDMFDIDSDIMTSAAGRLRRTSGRLAAEFTASFDDQVVTVMGQYGRKGNIQASMEQWFDDVMGRGLSQAIGASQLPQYLQDLTAGLTKAEEVSGAIGGLFQRFDGVNATLETLRLSAFELSDAGLRGADSLLSLSAAIAGLEDPTAADKIASLGSLTSAYYDGFFTETEKADNVIKSVTEQFEALGLAVPDVRSGFRDIAQGLDLTTDAGRQMFVSLMSMAGQASSYFNIVESRANEVAQATAALVAAQQQTLMDSAGAAFATTQRSIQAERDRLTREYQAAVTREQEAAAQASAAASAAASARAASLNDMAATSQEAVQALSGIDSAMRQALERLMGTSAGTVEMLRGQSLAVLESALALGRAGKSLVGFEGLEAALERASTVDGGLYSSLTDFEREQGRTANMIAELSGINGKQLSAEEKLLEQLRASAQAAQSAASVSNSYMSGISSQLQTEYDRAIAALDEELAAAQAQMDALNGIDNSILTVGMAVDQMSAAIVAALNGQQSLSTGTEVTGNAATIDRLYRSILGSGADSSGQAFWQDALSGAYSYSDLIAGLQAEARARAAGIPAFASGGFHSGGLRLVGERGPELEVTGPSRIYNAADTAAMLKGGNDGSRDEIRALRRDVNELMGALRSIAKHTMKTSKNTEILDQWNFDGMPRERA